MDLGYYQHLAGRTRNEDELEVVNYGLGITGEAGEVADLIKKSYFHGHRVPIEDLAKELGDVLWYVAMLATVHDLNLNDIAKKNIEKLEKRFPEGFSQKDSINRVE